VRAVREATHPLDRRLRFEGSFALAVQPIELVEARHELLREAELWLRVWERTGDERAAGRLLQALETIPRLLPGPR
jgi:hypothetical protein